MPNVLQDSNSAMINGELSAGGVNSSINANFACLNNTTPTGTVSGTLEFPTFAGPIRSFTFSSNNPSVASGFDSDGKESAEAIFENVTVTEIGGPTTTDCTLVVNGTQTISGSWDGTFVIICPEGLRLMAYGTFTGEVNVETDVFFFCTSL